MTPHSGELADRLSLVIQIQSEYPPNKPNVFAGSGIRTASFEKKGRPLDVGNRNRIECGSHEWHQIVNLSRSFPKALKDDETQQHSPVLERTTYYISLGVGNATKGRTKIKYATCGFWWEAFWFLLEESIPAEHHRVFIVSISIYALDRMRLTENEDVPQNRPSKHNMRPGMYIEEDKEIQKAVVGDEEEIP